MRSIHSSWRRTFSAAVRGMARNTPTNPKSVPMTSSPNITTAGWRETARLITMGCIRFPSIAWMIKYATITHKASIGSVVSARSTGGITEITGPRNGTKEIRPLKIPSRSAKGIPIMNIATVKRSPIRVMEVSCPRNHLWTTLYISPRISLTL